jgi:hypothetical protein
MGGAVDVATAHGVGTTFWVDFGGGIDDAR